MTCPMAPADATVFTYDDLGRCTTAVAQDEDRRTLGYDRASRLTTLLSYAGQYTDSETGYQYLRARDYDPASWQFALWSRRRREAGILVAVGVIIALVMQLFVS